MKLKNLRNQKQKKNDVVRIKTNFNMRKVMENQQIDQETLQGVMHQDEFSDEIQGPIEDIPNDLL